MRKAIIWIATIFGAMMALLPALGESLGLKVLFAFMGGITAWAIARAICGAFGLEKGLTYQARNDSLLKDPFAPEERARNYWRDKGKLFPMPGHPQPEQESGTPDNGTVDARVGMER